MDTAKEKQQKWIIKYTKKHGHTKEGKEYLAGLNKQWRESPEGKESISNTQKKYYMSDKGKAARQRRSEKLKEITKQKKKYKNIANRVIGKDNLLLPYSNYQSFINIMLDNHSNSQELQGD